MSTETNGEEKATCKFETKCINQAAWLWCQEEATLVGLKNEEERLSVILFLFEIDMSEAALSSLIFQYANEKSMVEPVSFVNNQNKLRDLLYLKKKNERKTNVRSNTAKGIV